MVVPIPSHSHPSPITHSHSHFFRIYIPIPSNSYSHCQYLEYLKAQKCVYSVIFQNKNYHLGTLHQNHYKSSFLIIVIYHYLSFVSHMSVNYIRCSSVNVNVNINVDLCSAYT